MGISSNSSIRKVPLSSLVVPQDKIKHLYKFVNLHHNNKIFDKLLKSNIHSIQPMSSNSLPLMPK